MNRNSTTNPTRSRVPLSVSVRARSSRRAGRRDDSGLTLIEVMVAFTVLLIALIPLSYLFTTTLISAGQSTNQQTALSIAERWAETLSNATPPVNATTGAVIVDTQEAPSGPAPSSAATTVSGTQTLSSSTTTITVAANGTANFAAATAANPQTAYVVTGTGSAAVTNQITYTASTSNTLTCSCSSLTGSATMNSGNAVTQTNIATPTESRGGTTYTLESEYEWATVQNTGVVSIAVASGSVGQSLPQSTITLASVSSLLPATSTSPQALKVPTSSGTQTVSYTGINTALNQVTGVTGGSGTLSSGNATQTPEPNLCTTGTPQLLKLTVTVSWGPNADTNNVQDSVMLNYPPSGVETLGFIALQLSGDSSATDAQGDPWSERVTSIPVTITGTSTGTSPAFTVYPDQNGCVFAQVLPGNYTVGVQNATSGTPQGTNYGSPSFVANTSNSVVTNPWQPPTTEPQGGTPSISVAIGAVTRVDTSYSAYYPSYDQGSTVNFTYPTSTAVEDGVSCPGAAQVACVTSGESAAASGADILWQNTTTNNWNSLTVPTGLTRQTSVACAGTTACIGVGYGPSGAVIIRGSTGSTASVGVDTLPTIAGATITNLSQVTCPSSTQCVAIGTLSTNLAVVLSGTIGSTSGACSTNGADCWTADTLPATVTSLSSLQCPTTTGCAAVATTTTTTAPTIVSGPVSTGTWSNGTFPAVTVSALTQVVCPNSTSCMAIGAGKIGSSNTTTPVVLSGVVTGGTGLGSSGSTATWSADTYTPATDTVTAVSSIVCPVTGTTPKCLVTATGGNGTLTGAVFLYGPPAGPLASEFPTLASAAIASITQVTCPSSTQCMATGISSGTAIPLIYNGTITAAPTTADTWTRELVPSITNDAINTLNQITCSATSNCVIAATGTASSSPAGFLLATSNGTTWTNQSLPASDNVLYFNGVACASGASANCAAVGATANGAVILSSSSGPTGAWSDGTPTGLGGYNPTGIPIEISNANLAPSSYFNAVTAGYTTSITQLPLLYPFQAGYSLWAGDCQAEGVSYGVAQATTIPGGTSGVTSGMASPVIPLGQLWIQLKHTSSGLAYSGAAVTLTATTTGTGCNADTYTLQTTGPDGLSRSQVPFGSYTLRIAGTSVGSVVVGQSSDVFTPTSGSATTYALPTPLGLSQ
jgi:Tfp pilus assembly protein PilV